MSEVLAPCAGRVLPVTDCVDPVFAGQLVGPGVVIDPPDGEVTVTAPIDGTVAQVAWVAAAGGFAMLPDLDQRVRSIGEW